MTQNAAVEKDFVKIDEELGEDHVRDVVQNLMNVEENEKAFQNLMDLHKQCCSVFAKYPSRSNSASRVSANSGSIKKKPSAKK